MPTDAALGFECARGREQAEFWAKAAQVAATNSATIYVLPGQGFVPLFGFYAICMARLQVTDLPSSQRTSLPSQCPVALLAQLARDDRAPKGTGDALVGHAIERIVEVSDAIGCIGIILDAQNAGLVSYYERLGFIPIGTSKNQTRRLFMGVHDARASVEAAR